MIASLFSTRRLLLSAVGATCLILPASLLPLATPALAEDSWNPFSDGTERPKTAKPASSDRAAEPSPYLPPMQGPPDGAAPAQSWTPPASPYSRPPGPYAGPQAAPGGAATATPSVERGELAPIMSPQPGPPSGAPSGARSGLRSGPRSAPAPRSGPPTSPQSRLPYAMWQGLSVSDAEQLVAPLALPSRSPALQALWLRLLATTNAGPQDRDFTAFRAEALFRSGRLDDAATALASVTSDRDAPTLLALKARVEVARGNRDVGCPAAKTAGRLKSRVAAGLRGEIIVLAGYCAVAAGNKSAAGLAAELARNEGYRKHFTLAVLDAIASGRSTRSVLPKRVTALDYHLLKEAGFDQAALLVARASPALLVLLTTDRAISGGVAVAAAEQAARRNIITPAALAEAYRRYRPTASAAEPALAEAVRRAELFQQADRTRTPLSRTRTIRTLIDDARRTAPALPILAALYPFVDQIRPAQEIGWFSSTAIEVMLAAADYRAILPWIALSEATDRTYADTDSLTHWRILADIADPAMTGRTADLTALEVLAARGRLSGPTLHRLTTVLDALNYNVPIPVWDAANRAPKPSPGTLPPTGILSQLLAASKRKETARTALLAMRAIGAKAPAEAHPIALGDAIRGLSRAGLVTEAKRLAFEAVFASWPRPRGY